MKKTILLALLVAGLSSCNSAISQRDGLIITEAKDVAERRDQPPYGGYGYKFKGTDLVIYSDSVYRVGDTLKISK